jgi:transposase InsO family protein
MYKHPTFVKSRRIDRFTLRLAPEYPILHSLSIAQVLIEQWRRHYNEVRPHSSLGYRPPAPKAIISKNKTKEFEGTVLSTH